MECIVQNEGLDKEWNEEDEVERKVLVNKEATQAEEMLVWREACYTALERHAEDATVQVTRCKRSYHLNILVLLKWIGNFLSRCPIRKLHVGP